MADTLTLVPGRSSKQGTSLNAGKLKDEYLKVTSTVEINVEDMERLGLAEGDQVRLRSAFGEALASCKGRKATDLPSGVVFMAYGPPSSLLMDGDTAGSGMPLSKNIEVEIQRIGSTTNQQSADDA